MSGLEFLEALKNKNLDHKIPILISSQLSKIKDISDAVASGMEIGVKSYIIKASQNMKMIIKTIENTLKNT